jgi:mannosyltransferase OCH1-like enzyme
MNKIILNNNNKIINQKDQQKRKQIKNLFEYLNLKRKLTIRYPLKQTYNSVIPLNIFQTWHTKNLTPSMNYCVNVIRNNNPRFHYQLFDDEDCREFIKNNFNVYVLEAYDTLIPGAYKADLWRYCILYKRGGIYLDIKYKPINHFKFITLTEKEHWVLDVDNNGIYNAVMICKPGNEILRRAINQVVENVKKRFYGSNALEPTGPLMLSRFFDQSQKKGFDMKHHVYFSDFNYRFVSLHNILVFKSYPGYLDDYSKTKKTDYYGALWTNRQIYK